MLGAVLSTYIPSAFAPASTPPNPDTVVTARGEQGKPLGQGEQASIAGTGAGAGAGADAGAGAGAGAGVGVGADVGAGAVAAAATSAAITFSRCSSSSGDASGGLSRYPAAQIRILATHAPGFPSSFPGATLSRSAQWPCALSIDPSSLYANTGLPWELFLPWNIGDITWDSVPGTLHELVLTSKKRFACAWSTGWLDIIEIARSQTVKVTGAGASDGIGAARYRFNLLHT
uniref:Uncharacterized protein n=1 Tax=Vespula pensylvanica TaxID=30213 RepID=A0A834PA30_VESPE|nr:hypothetical protein H0235_002428 [Vespula pensylvanica]